MQAEAIENQALEEPVNTRDKKDRAKGCRRAGRPTRRVHENDGDRPLAGGKRCEKTRIS